MIFPLLSFAIFRYSSVGFLAIFFLCWGFSLLGLSPSPLSSQRMVPVGFILLVFVPALSLCYSSSHLCILSVLLVLALGLSFIFLCLVRLYSFLFFSLSLHWVVLVIFFGFSEVSHSISASGGALLLSFFRSFMPPLHLPALQVPLSRPLAISFCYRSFFADPPSTVRSRPFFLYFPSGYSVLLYTVFLLGPAVAPRFYFHIHDFNVTIPCFLFIGLVLFLFRNLVRFPSLSAGSESLGGPLTLPSVLLCVELFGCCHAPCGLRVVLTPLYGIEGLG